MTGNIKDTLNSQVEAFVRFGQIAALICYMNMCMAISAAIFGG